MNGDTGCAMVSSYSTERLLLQRPAVSGVAAAPPAETAEAAKVLNPDIPKDYASEKAILLDVRATLSDGRLVNVEMQARRDTHFRERILYYWARNFGSQLEIGEEYQRVLPCVGIYVLDFMDLQGQTFHSVFRVSNLKTHEVLSNALEMHFLELPKLPPDAGASPVYHWGRFFSVRNAQRILAIELSAEKLEQIAKMDAESLEELSETLLRDRRWPDSL